MSLIRFVGVLLFSAATLWPIVSYGTCTVPVEGLIGWWKGEGSVSNLVDGRTGTFQGADYDAGMVGNGFRFNGTNASVSIPRTAALDPGNQFTIEFWMSAATANPSIPCCQGLVTSDFYGIEITDNQTSLVGINAFISTNSGTGFIGTAQANGAAAFIAVGEWHHVACTYDGLQLQLYIDGQPAGNPAAGGGAVSAMQTNSFLSVGSELGRTYCPSCTGARYYKGLIDEPALFNRALSGPEIFNIYVAGAEGKCTNSLPVIISQPPDTSVPWGQSALFSASAGGSPMLRYQWRFYGTNLPGATNTSLVFTNLQLSQTGPYTFVVSNGYGSATSSVTHLTVLAPVCVKAADNLVAWWRGETNAWDQLGQNDGALSGAFNFGTGEVTNAFLFSGTGGYLRAPATPALDVGPAGGFTIELWLNPSNAAANEVIAEWNNGAGQAGVHFWLSQPAPFGTGAGCLYANIIDNTGAFHFITTPPGLVQSGRFQHVALTYDGSSGVAAIYYNGTLAASTNAGSFTPQTSFDFYLGARVSGQPSGYFAGGMDEASLYNRALGSSEIQAIYNAGAGGKCLVFTPVTFVTEPQSQTVYAGNNVRFAASVTGTRPLQYQWFHDNNPVPGATGSSLLLTNVSAGSGGNYRVEISNANGMAPSDTAVLTVNPAPACAAPPAGLAGWWKAEGNGWDQAGGNNGLLATGSSIEPVGLSGQAFSFTAAAGSLVVPDAPNLRVTNQFTIESWINFSALPTSDASILSKVGGAGGNNGYQLLFSNGRLQGQMNSPGGPWPQYRVEYDASSLVSTGTWIHVAFSYDGTAMRLYWNGAAVATNAIGSNLVATSASSLRISGDDNNHVYFPGLIDELSLYNRALTPGEIVSIYNANAAGKCPLSIAPFAVLSPTNVSAAIGATVTMRGQAGGSPMLSYQWRFNGADIAGATTNTLSLANVQAANGGSYSFTASNAFGSITSSPAVLSLIFPQPVVRIPGTNVSGASIAALPVLISANGNENALSFSLSYDASKVTFAGASLSSVDASGILIANTSQTNSGRVGISIALPPFATLPAGTQTIIQVFFAITNVASSGGSTMIFGDAPILRQVSDAQLNPITVTWASPAFTITAAAGLEADAYPRGAPDKTFSILDWLQLGRFVARLDTPTNAAEFQRADCAPRATLGDGSLRASDWVQAGRYLAGLDAVTAMGGPTNETAGPDPGPSASRILNVGQLSLTAGQSGMVPVMLASQGNENGLSFSVAFDPAKLAFLGAVSGTDAAGATLLVNTNQAAAGRVGFCIARNPGTMWTSGARELVELNFQALFSSGGQTSITLGDQPVIKEISDAQANALAASYLAGTAVIGSSVSLQIARNGPGIALAWPLWGSNLALQASGSLTSGPWTNVPATVVQTNGQNTVNLPASTARIFYRLTGP